MVVITGQRMRGMSWWLAKQVGIAKAGLFKNYKRPNTTKSGPKLGPDSELLIDIYIHFRNTVSLLYTINRLRYPYCDEDTLLLPLLPRVSLLRDSYLVDIIGGTR